FMPFKRGAAAGGEAPAMRGLGLGLFIVGRSRAPMAALSPSPARRGGDDVHGPTTADERNLEGRCLTFNDRPSTTESVSPDESNQSPSSVSGPSTPPHLAVALNRRRGVNAANTETQVQSGAERKRGPRHERVAPIGALVHLPRLGRLTAAQQADL